MTDVALLPAPAFTLNKTNVGTSVDRRGRTGERGCHVGEHVVSPAP